MLSSIYLFLTIQLLFVSYLDIKYKIIKNYWPIINITFFIILLLTMTELYYFKIDNFFLPFVFLVIGFMLYVLKVMGAGDVKYIFSIFLLIPHNLQKEFVMILLYSTLIVSILVITYKTLRDIKIVFGFIIGRDLKSIVEIYGSKISYAPVVLISWVWFGWENFIKIQ